MERRGGREAADEKRRIKGAPRHRRMEKRQ